MTATTTFQLSRYSAPVRETLFATQQTKQSGPSSPTTTTVLRCCPEQTSTSTSTTTATARSLLALSMKHQDPISSSSLHESPSSSSLFTTTSSSSSSSLSSMSLSSSRRRVAFTPRDAVRNTLSRHDMTQTEKESVWLQQDEFRSINRQNRRLICYVEECRSSGVVHYDDSKNDSEHCECEQQGEQQDVYCNNNSSCYNINIRGLESGLKFESLRKKTSRWNALQQVLMEQDKQRARYEYHYDVEAIANVYIKCTSPCQSRAQYKAIEDRAEVAH